MFKIRRKYPNRKSAYVECPMCGKLYYVNKCRKRCEQCSETIIKQKEKDRYGRL